MLVVHRVCLGLPHHVAGLHRARVDQAQLGQLAAGKGDEVVVGGGPQVVADGDEVLQPQAGTAVLDQVRRPRPEVLDPPDPHLRVVDVDPVVREPGGLRHHQGDGEDVAVVQRGRGIEHPLRRRRRHAGDQIAERHGGHHVGDRDPLAPATTRTAGTTRTNGTAGADRDGAARPAVDADHRRVHPDLDTRVLDLLPHPVPHHPGTEFGVVELVDQRGDRGPVALQAERVPHRREQRQVLDPLRRPVGLDLPGVDAPHLLGVGLEERAVQPPPETRGDPALEVALVARRVHPHRQVRDDTAHGLGEAEVAQRVSPA
ncbi:hypothetical protein GCM10011594_01420 [Nakamurella endophytica]|uniref:Uncharacterized protein n=1 Tax=Nakamurella endophytica TaxID=1748367 RepID=A0A917SJH4_9ACTN|nr:hypothetical protein [Nakamurella endophytica]GGL85472.1 hypothetical protein GCM10011594_01420 [Nakamurella endophytica]